MSDESREDVKKAKSDYLKFILVLFCCRRALYDFVLTSEFFAPSKLSTRLQTFVLISKARREK